MSAPSARLGHAPGASVAPKAGSSPRGWAWLWPTIVASLLAASLAQAQTSVDLTGDWTGSIAVGGRDIPVVFHIGGTPARPTATFDSPTQGATGLPVASVREEKASVSFRLAAPAAEYDGVLSADSGTLSGEWHQGGATLPLTLVHASKAAKLPARPQTPRPPFPYRSIEVAYENAADHVHLAGTLTEPLGSGPFPVVLLITGSGLQDRDETIAGHRPFLVWADALTRRGIAVLRVDDRQIGGSTGDVAAATTQDFARDVAAGVAFLRGRSDIDPRRVGLMGHSEGADIAAMVAAQDRGIAFAVLLAGSGTDGETLLLAQKRLVETAAGLPPEQVERSNRNMRSLYEAVKGAPDTATAERRLEAAWHALAPAAATTSASSPLPDGLRAIAQPWLRWFLGYDPRPELSRLRCPVLAVAGSRDLQVPPAVNLTGIRSALRDNPDATVLELPGLNHLFQTASSGAPDEYGRIEETLSPSAVRTVGDWIVAHVAEMRSAPAAHQLRR